MPSSNAARAVALSPDGRLAVCEYEPTRLRLLDPADGRTLATLTMPVRDPVGRLVFSPGSQTLIAATSVGTWLFDLGKMRHRLRDMGLDLAP